MSNRNKKAIMRQMFDVRPVDAEGDLDFSKINKIGQVLKANSQKTTMVNSSNIMRRIVCQDIVNVPTRLIAKRTFPQKQVQKFDWDGFNISKKAQVYRFGQVFDADKIPIVHQSTIRVAKKVPRMERKIVTKSPVTILPKKDTDNVDFSIGERLHQRVLAKIEQEKKTFSQIIEHMFTWKSVGRTTFSFSGLAMLILIFVAGIGFFNKGLGVRDAILGTGKEAYFDLALAKDGMLSRDFEKSSFEFSEASAKFEKISHDLNDLGGILIGPSKYLPFMSKLSSGNNMAQAGKNISRIGILASEIMQTMDKVKNPLNKEETSVSFLEIFKETDKNLREIVTLLEDTEMKLNGISADDIPEAQRVQFVELRNQLPEIHKFIISFLESSEIMTDVLGGNGPRKYLFLFQNNQEMRATGGFIGTYGVLDIFNGNIRNFFIDGVYNPDGQLREKVVPPEPIQKMSATWSLHDSNWFPDFPKSAEKAAWFYEKTGGPTVDGVITMTPNVMERLLEVTGPIEMADYGIIVDKNNFTETVQQEVEVDYDKELNQPKKILADLAPKILDRIFNAKNFSDMVKTMNILTESLHEKQILIYSKNYDIEKMLSQEGWSGEMLKTEGDYLNVINTNINGYKTDGVIDEEISHQAEIQADGSIVDTVTIKRHHNGGSLAKDWWNKVNSNYMRIYVPKGSQLLSAEGQTREFNSPPLDYKKLAFKWDAQVRQEEDSMRIDEESGTRVYEDSEKTVFANWVYVSPQETVVVKYRYLLPFKMDMWMTENPVDTYSLLVQKQSGSIGSKFFGKVTYPETLETIWSYPESIRREKGILNIETDLKEDKFLGVAFTKK